MWNALGDVEIKKHNDIKDGHTFTCDVLECGLVDDNEIYMNALRWCLTETVLGICFFDFNFEGVTVEDKHINAVGSLARSLVPDNIEPLKYFNGGRHGLLLAAALEVNPNADADIWIVTGYLHHLEVENIKKNLEHNSRKRRVWGFEDSIGTAGSGNSAERKLYRAVNQHIDKRFSVEARFWTMDSAAWFMGTDSSPYHDFKPRSASCQAVLLPYLRNLHVPDALTEKWLSSQDFEGFYDTLKHFVGNFARAQDATIGKKPLKLNCLIIPLILAVGEKHKVWMDGLDWGSSSPLVFCAPSTQQMRDFVIGAYKLFSALGTEKTLHQPNDVKVSRNDVEELNNSLSVLSIDFKIDCEIDDDGKGSLLARTGSCDNLASAGNATLAFRSLQDLIAKSNCPSRLSLSIKSIESTSHDKQKWTRLTFSAKRIKPSDHCCDPNEAK